MEEENRVQRQPVPWELRQEIGVFKALWQTIVKVLLKPGEFFNSLEIKGYGEPLAFYVLLSAIVVVVSLSITLLWNMIFPPKGTFSLVMYIIFSLLAVPLIVVFLYVGAAITHLFVLLFRGKGGFRGTFYVLAYAGATSVVAIIPVAGGIISAIWSIIVGVIGFKRVHQMGTVRALLAYLGVPIVVFVMLLAIGVALPGLLRTRLQANESAAEATLRTISTAIESYKAQTQKYPTSEEELGPYLKEKYDNQEVFGYKYSLHLDDTGYVITASPSRCGISGTKNFEMKSGGVITKEECVRSGPLR